MNFRKLTSLLMMIGLISSLFHPLAHAGSADHNGNTKLVSEHGRVTAALSQPQTLIQIVRFEGLPSAHDENGFATTHCEVCHDFAHIFAISGNEKSLPFTRMPVHSGMVPLPLTAEALRFDRPPRLVARPASFTRPRSLPVDCCWSNMRQAAEDAPMVKFLTRLTSMSAFCRVISTDSCSSWLMVTYGDHSWFL